MNRGSDIRFGIKTADLISQLPARYQDKYEKGIGIAKPKIRTISPFGAHSRNNSLNGIPYETLLDAFGEPYGGAPGDTSDAQWFLQVMPTRELIAIWNHKNGPNYLGKGDVRDIEDWSVYASTPEAYETLLEYLQHYPEDSPQYEGGR